MICYRKATLEDLERSWNREIQENPGDSRYLRWKKQFITMNQTGAAATFMVLEDGNPVGQATVLFDPNARPVAGRPGLCDGRQTANINALRIEKRLEGQGHISKLMNMIGQYAKAKGITTLTIGVEAAETRNLAIYLHWGYNRFVLHEEEDGELIVYYAKELT